MWRSPFILGYKPELPIIPANSANKNALMCSLDLIRFPTDGWNHCFDRYTWYNPIIGHTALYTAHHGNVCYILLHEKCAASAYFNIQYTWGSVAYSALPIKTNPNWISVSTKCIAIPWEPCTYACTYIWTFVWALISQSSYGVSETWAQSVQEPKVWGKSWLITHVMIRVWVPIELERRSHSSSLIPSRIKGHSSRWWVYYNNIIVFVSCNDCLNTSTADWPEIKMWYIGMPILQLRILI